MMNFLIAPDFAPEHFAGWYMLNAVLQKKSGRDIHLLTPTSADQQTAFLQNEPIHLMYANPFDTACLVREKGYQALVKPRNMPDEMVIAVSAESPVSKVEALKSGCKIAVTQNRGVRLIGLRLLESANLTEDDIQWVEVDTHQAAARLVINHEVDACFLLASVYHSLASLSKSRLRVLVESLLEDISHVLLISPQAASERDIILTTLLEFTRTPEGRIVLQELGFTQGFEAVDEESMEFMIDLMDTLI